VPFTYPLLPQGFSFPCSLLTSAPLFPTYRCCLT
jgi:hypothetical protein